MLLENSRAMKEDNQDLDKNEDEQVSREMGKKG